MPVTVLRQIGCVTLGTPSEKVLRRDMVGFDFFGALAPRTVLDTHTSVSYIGSIFMNSIAPGSLF